MPSAVIQTKPLPRFIIALGEHVAHAVRSTTGIDIPYQEGLMLIVSSVVLITFMVLWAIIEVGNRADKREHMAMLEARALQRLSAASASNSSASSRAPQHPGPFPASSAHPSAAPSLPPKRSIELERLQELARCAATLSGANVYEGCADDTPRTSTVLPPGQAGGGDAGADGRWQMGAGGGGGHGVRHRPRAPVVPR